MKTLTLTVKNKKDYQLLIDFAKRLGIDVKVNPQSTGQSSMEQLYKLMDSVKGQELFTEIKDPLQWQKKMRDEW